MPRGKRVFRIWKWMQSLGYEEDAIKTMEMALKSGWPQECEGKTVKECPVIILSAWVVEE